jgi:hypothetical protein
VVQVDRHPGADLAVISVESRDHKVQPFKAVGALEAGQDFIAFGYPENVYGPHQRMPTARIFKGHVQRLFTHRSHQGFDYFAAELSIGCPAGLSGGPLFRLGDENAVCAMAAENIDSVSAASYEEETDSQGRRVIFQRVLTYGIAVVLRDVSNFVHDKRG